MSINFHSNIKPNNIFFTLEIRLSIFGHLICIFNKNYSKKNNHLAVFYKHFNTYVNAANGST